MKNLNFLSNLCGLGRASQSSDVGSRCRVVADLLPSFCRVNHVLTLLVVMLFTIGVGNVWADYTVTFSTSSFSFSSGGSYVSTSEKSSNGWEATSDGFKYGASKNTGYTEFTMTSSGTYIGQIKASKITFNDVLVYGTDGSSLGYVITYVEGGTTSGTVAAPSSAGNKDVNLDNTKTVQKIKIYSTANKKRFYCKGFTVTAAAAATTVTASPNSITFDGVELDPEDGAEGSKTTTITLSNGYASSGNYLFGWFEDVSDEDHCEFFVNSASTYSYTTSGSATPTLTLSYLADAAGTFTGNFIIQGYNSSYAAVNCTIPLSVTISAPACANQVTLTKGAQTNGTFSLNKSNGSYDNCLSNFVVTVSSISPSAGYACTGVTATGGNSTVTGPDGSGNYTVTYTKGNTISSTVTANFAAKVATPTFSPTAGTYTGAQNVSISCGTADATIYYTTNGSTPTASSSVYSSPISVTQGTTIKAFATKAGMPNSDVATAAYVIRYTVSWSVNGTSYSSPVVVTAGSTTSTPANPTPSGDCAGLVFRGWTATANYEHATDAPGNMFNSTTPPITGDITFHAVFAEEDD